MNNLDDLDNNNYTIEDDIFSVITYNSLDKFLTIEKDNNYNNNYNKEKKMNGYKYFYNMYYKNLQSSNSNKQQIDNIYLCEKIYDNYIIINRLINSLFFIYFLFNKVNIINSLLLLSINLFDLNTYYKNYNTFKLKLPENTPDDINTIENITHLKLMMYYNNFINSMIFLKVNKLCIHLILVMYMYLLYNNNIYFITFIFTDLILYSIYLFFSIIYIIIKV